jgi:FkbM family methyltransferase
MISECLSILRSTRNRVPGFGMAQSFLREPWYRTLQMLFPRGVSVRLAGGEHVRLQPRLLSMRPEVYEEALTAMMIKHLKPGFTVIDVGAHVGLHALMFSRRVGPMGRVLAVEPSPASARLLRQHIAWNDCHNVEVIEAAAGDRQEQVSFTFHPDATHPHGFANSLAYKSGGATNVVPMTTIDAICAGRTPHLIKMDVEGAELLALRGARETLARCSPILIIAIHPDELRVLGASPTELVGFLDAFGYQGRDLDGRYAVDPGFEEVIFTKRTRAQ